MRKTNSQIVFTTKDTKFTKEENIHCKGTENKGKLSDCEPFLLRALVMGPSLKRLERLEGAQH